MFGIWQGKASTTKETAGAWYISKRTIRRWESDGFPWEVVRPAQGLFSDGVINSESGWMTGSWMSLTE